MSIQVALRDTPLFPIHRGLKSTAAIVDRYAVGMRDGYLVVVRGE